jgi:inactive STAND
LGLLELVNANRAKPIRRFTNLFDEKKEQKQPFQFYFLAGCPDEMPHSLAERIVYNLLKEKELELKTSLDYPFVEGDLLRVKVENLPLSTANVSESKIEFKKYVQKRFAFANTESFEKFIETGIPKLPYSHVATVFKITESDWEDDQGELTTYLQWMMDTFKTPHTDVPTFLFLFVLPFRHLHDPNKVKKRNLEIIEQLEAFCEQNQTAVLRDLTPIRQTHFEDWLGKLGIDNPNDYEPLVNAVYQSLKPEDQLFMDEERHFHMKDVEPIQKKVILHYRKGA